MPRVLVVDDEESIRLLYREEFQDDGYEVELASSGEEAIEKITASPPDLVTLDIKMPGIDGLEVLSRIRDVSLELPVIICTAYGSYKQDFGTWGSDVYLTKSADMNDLRAEVRRLLKEHGKL